MKNIRYYIFFFKEYVSKKNNILNHYNEIKHIMNDSYTKEKTQKEKLNDILLHAKQTTEWYKDIDINNFNEIQLLKREDIINNYEKFISKKYVNKPYRVMQTSGSSGIPLKIRQNMDKKKRNLADVIFFNKCGNQFIGDRYLFLRGWIKEYKKSKINQFMTNLIPIDITTLDSLKLKYIKDTLLRDNKINCIIGYANTLYLLGKFLEENNIKIYNIKSIISSSEVLTKEMSKTIYKVFPNAILVSRYANQENGVLGQQNMQYDYFLMNEASYYIEILSLTDNKPVKIGEVGKIVVTDLYNKYMPIIRYDTGDLARLKAITPYMKIDEIVGRIADSVYDTNGNIISVSAFSNHLEMFEWIKQYQLIQISSKDYILKIVAKENNNVKFLYAKLKKIFGSNSNITIEIVDKIEQEKSGKTKTMINETKR